MQFLCKAFDIINHELLLAKLKLHAYGFSILLTLPSYLSIIENKE